ncbi:hypothetical protein NPIL_500961 [Nephila pilipes]|uniref:DUF4817 domain-containing protein n=1 Tax=Nephila pilipes TaxID=299642 RepID=A0A8X6M7C8_NEPPI|nr:hypothetical protein NPIL_500961 [Nephila pilipes]
MLNGKDKALFEKLFYMNGESETVALRNFRLQKNAKTGKGSLIVAGLIKRVQRFVETGSLEDRRSESAAGSSSAWEASRSSGLPPSLIRNILHGVLNQYTCKLQSCHELSSSDTYRENHLLSGLSPKLNMIPLGFKHLVDR